MSPLVMIAVVVPVAGFIEESSYALATAFGPKPSRSGVDTAGVGMLIGTSDSPSRATTSPPSDDGTCAAAVFA